MAEQCLYIYKGHKFTELELNDFLTANGEKLYSKYGDIVFDKEAQMATHAQVDQVAREAAEYQSKYKEAKEKRKYIDGEEVLEFKFPYIGVTGFLKGLTNAEDKLLTPEFREVSYWSKRIKAWQDENEGFNKDERDLFGNFSVITENITTKQLQKFLEEWDKGNDISGDSQILQLIKQMKEKWEAQGKMGTAIHDVLKTLFSPYRSGSRQGTLRIDNDEASLEFYFSPGKNRYDEKLLTQQHIKDIIKYAKNLKSELETKLKGPLLFFPEFQIASKLAQEIPEKGDTVLGIIDLLVVDIEGNAHIIDYKASPKDSFDTAKQRTFWYQLGFYNRLLMANSINTSNDENQVMIAPIKMVNFRRENGVFVMDGVKQRDDQCLEDITINATLHEVAANLDEFLPEKAPEKFSAQNLVSSVNTFTTHAFPGVSTSTEWDGDSLQTLIDNNGGIQENTKNGKFEITIFNETYSAKTKEEVYEKIEKYYTEVLPKKRRDMVKHVHLSLKKGISGETKNIQLPKILNVNSTDGANAEWFNNTIGKYCNNSYELIDNPAVLEYGVILLKNKKTKQIDVLKITTDNLDTEHFFSANNKKNKNRSLLIGNFRNDRQELRNSDSLALKATTGNIHLMETMAVLNCIPELMQPGVTIGNVQVANPHLLQGTSVGTNKELEYNFNEIVKGIQEKGVEFINNIPNIKFASKVILAANRLQDILALVENNPNHPQYNYFHQFHSLRTELDSAISNNDERIILEQLNALKKDLERKKSTEISLSLEQYQSEYKLEKDLYDKVMLAIAEIKGISFRQQTKDNKNYLESMEIHRNGVQSLMLDNPGNLNNDTLNVLTKLVSEAYQNVREDMQREMETVRSLVDNLKKDKGFNKLKAMTIGNAASLYTNMIKHENGDILFKNPWNSTEQLSEAEREFLKYTLTKINENRFQDRTDEDIEDMRASGNLAYYRIPLAVGDTASAAVVSGGLRKALKSKLKRLNPKVWYEEVQKKLQGVFTDINSTSDIDKVFEMNNMFDGGEIPKRRLEKIEKKGFDYFEHNLETLLLKHCFAYSTQKNINTVMPVAKASMIHLITQGHLTNKQYKNATNYVTDYIRNKVKNESLIQGEGQIKAAGVFGQLKYAASILTLGFSPIQYGYQMLQGFWTDIKIIIQNLGMEDSPFTWENFLFAGKQLFKDFFKLGNKPTKCSLINEYFGFNDMDMNVYADKIKSDQYGIFNISNIAFHGASRPDFYNRMLLFVAQMKQDGAWEAYSEKDGKLVYDWKEDKRFSAFAKGDTTDPLYKQQQGLYNVIAEQLIKEHTKNKNGSLFKYGDPLPKAYSNKQIEDFKSFSDNIYGYYAHEKKAMVHAMTWGTLWMQMRTFWSGKKNIYLGGPGIKLKGKYVHYHEIDKQTGEKIPWFMKEENGRMVPTKENTGIPFMKWEGEWQEGVFLTMAQLVNTSVEEGFKVAWDQLWDDPIQRQNMIQLAYDVTMFAMVGPLITGVLQDWDDELKKDANDIDEAAVAAAAHVAMKIVSSSFGDFNFIESIGGPLTNWTPFSFSYLGRQASELFDVCMGEKSFTDALLKMSTFTSSTKIFWDALLDNKN